MANISDSSETLLNWQQVVTDLGEHLKKVESDGSISCGRTYDSYQPPGISIRGMGDINLPLSPQQASQIASLCQDSTYAKMSYGENYMSSICAKACPASRSGMVDLDIRKTKELDLGMVEFQNPHWPDFLLEVKGKMCAGLGLRISTDNVTLEPYKMLLYEQGSKFRPHKDIEKAPGMFATLVICLPSEHTGGELVTQHMGREKVMETAPNSKFGITCIAWYTDVEHEVKPVLSGFRWCLTYGMIRAPGSVDPTALQVVEERNTTTSIVRRWLSDSTSPSYLVYPLVHEYTMASLRISMLKGDDAARCEHLKTTCRGLEGITFLFGGLLRELRWNPQGPPSEYNSMGDEDEEDDGVVESFRLHTIIDMCGNAFRYHASVEKSRMIGSDALYQPRRYEQWGGDHFSDLRADDIERVYQFTVLLLIKTSDMATVFPNQCS